ncbi:hypothetical protein DFH09DRAFT_1141556 [Mycena vulgaris]|nr:hypothetical protein DFH09DRAFT_1141556 [Mycena vulgaris]
MLAFLSLALTLLLVNIVHSAPSAIRSDQCMGCAGGALDRDLDARAVVISERHEDIHRAFKSDIDQDPPEL